MRDGTEHVFDGVDGLVDHDLAEGLVLVVMPAGLGLWLGRGVSQFCLFLHLDTLVYAAV